MSALKRSAISRMQTSEANKLLTDLGLGFGIDATSRNPWGQKSVCQVCPIRERENDVVIIDEGGSWQSFHQKVESQNELQGRLSSSLRDPNVPVSIAAGVEMSRRKVRSREVFGRRLVDCKASLRPHTVGTDDFEVMLSSWIVKRIRYLAKVRVESEKLPRTEGEGTKYALGKDEWKLAKKAANHKWALCAEVRVTLILDILLLLRL